MEFRRVLFRSYIFRVREAKWSNGDKVTAEAVAAILRSYLGRRSKNVLKDDFPEVETIKAMTDTVIEIRLSVPQPDLLELLAQPAMAIVNRGMGWGPMRPKKQGRAMLLTPVPDRKSVVEGKSVSVRVDLGGRRILKKKK